MAAAAAVGAVAVAAVAKSAAHQPHRMTVDEHTPSDSPCCLATQHVQETARAHGTQHAHINTSTETKASMDASCKCRGGACCGAARLVRSCMGVTPIVADSFGNHDSTLAASPPGASCEACQPAAQCMGPSAVQAVHAVHVARAVQAVQAVHMTHVVLPEPEGPITAFMQPGRKKPVQQYSSTSVSAVQR